jgi:hypothetical protein
MTVLVLSFYKQMKFGLQFILCLTFWCCVVSDGFSSRKKQHILFGNCGSSCREFFIFAFICKNLR